MLWFMVFGCKLTSSFSFDAKNLIMNFISYLIPPFFSRHYPTSSNLNVSLKIQVGSCSILQLLGEFIHAELIFLPPSQEI